MIILKFIEYWNQYAIEQDRLHRADRIGKNLRGRVGMGFEGHSGLPFYYDFNFYSISDPRITKI